MPSSPSFARPLVALLAVGTLVCSAPARATDPCDFEIQADLTVGPEQIVIEDRRLGEVLVGDSGDLSIDGRAVELDAAEREAVEAWASQVQTVVPAVVDLALDAMDLGVTAVTEVFAALVDGEPPAGVREALDDVRAEVHERLGREHDVWYVREDGISGPDDAMDSIGPLVERAVAESVASLLVSLGRSLQTEDDSLAARMDAFAARMERFEADIEARVERDAAGIERRADRLCEEMTTLAEREADLRSSVPALARLRALERG